MIFTLFPAKGLDDEIADAVEWYESKQPGLGLKFVEDWESSVEYLVSNPYSYQKRHKYLRYGYFKNFPYIIVYEIEEALIVVYSVVHASKQPQKRIFKAKRQ
jgi:plasmid stabilization system protein ParE